MNFPVKLKSLEHTFVGYAVKTFNTVMKYEPKAEQIASAGLKYVGGAVAEIIRIEYGPVAGDAADASLAVGQRVLNEIHQDVTVAGSLVYDAGVNPTAAGILQNVAANLDSLAQAGHIKNPKSIDLAKKALASTTAVVDVINHALSPEPVSAGQ